MNLLPDESRSPLEAPTQLGQFYSGIITEQNWIEGMEKFLSQVEIAKDFDAACLLLSEHKSLETEAKAHEKSLRQSLAIGKLLITHGNVDPNLTQETLDEVNEKWNNFIKLMNLRYQKKINNLVQVTCMLLLTLFFKLTLQKKCLEIVQTKENIKELRRALKIANLQNRPLVKPGSRPKFC